MKWFYLLSIVFQVSILLKMGNVIKVIGPTMATASLLYLYATLTYIKKMMDTECGCTSGQHRTLMFWLALGQAFLLMISAIVAHRVI